LKCASRDTVATWSRVDRHESGNVETGVYHVTSHGNARQAIFRDEVDYSTFLRMLAPVAADFGWPCSAFCLMPNHYHLLLEVPEGSLPRGMHLLNGRYARRFNVRHERVGHSFKGRIALSR
jgi:putative transposase